MKKGKVFMCVPTFREPQKAELLFACLKKVTYNFLEVIIINANPGDRTSSIIAEESRQAAYQLTEIEGKSEEFWSASINRGLEYVKSNMHEDDWVIIANIDIEFTDDIVTLLVESAGRIKNCQVGALAISNDLAISSGVIVKSWLLTLNRHPYAGCEKDSIPETVLEADYLPGRCFIYPAKYLKTAGIINAKKLPHYHADYEYSFRLSEYNCPAFIDTSIRIIADMTNTGLSVYDSKSTIRQRFSRLWSIKNPAHPYYRINMVLTMFPFYYVPFGIFFYMLRSLVEVLFANNFIQRLFKNKERGFSGSKA